MSHRSTVVDNRAEKKMNLSYFFFYFSLCWSVSTVPIKWTHTTDVNSTMSSVWFWLVQTDMQHGHFYIPHVFVLTSCHYYFIICFHSTIWVILNGPPWAALAPTRPSLLALTLQQCYINSSSKKSTERPQLNQTVTQKRFKSQGLGYKVNSSFNVA